MSANWPLEATPEDHLPVPPPWDGDIDLDDRQTETALLALQRAQPELLLAVCHGVFCKAEARGDKQSALHALYLVCICLYNTSQRVLADKVFTVVRERARGIGASYLSVRIDLTCARLLGEQGEREQPMAILRGALDAALALGETRLIFAALGALATSAIDSGDAELALSLCEQQQPLLSDSDEVIAPQRSHHAHNMALVWKMLAQAHGAAGEQAAATAALERARVLALSACAAAKDDRAALYGLDVLVQVLLLLDRASEARTEFARCTALLAVKPGAGGELWCTLELARARIDVHDGCAGLQTVETLRVVEATSALGVDAPFVDGVRQVLLRAQEQLGDCEQALALHKRSTDWHDMQRSARSRWHLKTLRHAVLAMRAEAVEFVAHDLLTPLAAAQTWMQTLLRERMQSPWTPLLRDTQKLLDRATTLSEQYLGLLRAELIPSTQMQVLDFGALVDDVCEKLLPSMSSGFRFARVIDIGTPVCGDATLLTKMLTALLEDAFDRAPAGSRVELLLKRDIAVGEAALSIVHTGVGSPAAMHTRLYRESFDSEMFAAGNLGLALAAKVCRLHRMRLRFEAARGAGSAVRLVAKTVAWAANAR